MLQNPLTGAPPVYDGVEPWSVSTPPYPRGLIHSQQLIWTRVSIYLFAEPSEADAMEYRRIVSGSAHAGSYVGELGWCHGFVDTADNHSGKVTPRPDRGWSSV